MTQTDNNARPSSLNGSRSIVQDAVLTRSQKVAVGGPIARRFRPDIQGLRALAVLLVVLYHAGVPFVSGGFVGVDVFFVISGFLITRQLNDEVAAKGRISFTDFYARRARRLLPPAALVVLTTLLVARLVLPYSQIASLVKDALSVAIYGLNYHLAAEGTQYQNASVPPSALQHFWSLAVEEQFYVLWPLLIAGCTLVGGRYVRKYLTFASIISLCLITIYLSVTVTRSDTSLAYFSLQTRAWELGLGALVALSSQQLTRVPGAVARILSWTGLALVLGSAVFYSAQTAYPGSAALAPVVGAAAIIGGGVLRNNATPETLLLDKTPMQYIGKTSYSWYLWHWPMLILLTAWVGHNLNTWEKLEIVVLAFWFAVLTYFLENASHRSSWNARRWVLTGGLLSACVAVGALTLSSLMPSLSGGGVARHTVALSKADPAVVQAAINRSLNIHALPSNLTPQLNDAVNDRPTYGSQKNCLAGLLDRSSPGCVFGAPNATKTAVLLGDSHADQWLTPLTDDAVLHGWKVVELTKSACPIADVQVWNNSLNRHYTECDAFRTWAAAQVQQLKPALIIASQSNVVPWKDVTDQAWADKTLTALNNVAGKTAKIVYIGDSPTTAQNPVTCLEQHIQDAAKCAYPTNTAYDIFEARYSTLATAVWKSGMGYIDTPSFLCNRYVCPAVVDNMVTHRDEGHITNTYAKWLAPMLAPIFEGAAR